MTISVELSEIGDYIGRELGPTEWFELSQDRIDQFAELTNDHQFIHVDAEKAAQTPLGTTIAHGFFSLDAVVISQRIQCHDQRYQNGTELWIG